MTTEPKYDVTSLKTIRRLLKESKDREMNVIQRQKVRRQLIIRDADNIMDNLTGTYLPPPFHETALAIRTMIGETAKAAQHYASRIAANDPDIAISPPSTKSEITATLDKNAGEQERIDSSLWESVGGKEKQWDAGMHMAIGGVNYYLTEVRDAGFGLPDREYYDDSDEELELLKKAGKVAPLKVPHPRTGKFMYAEHADVWAERRKQAHQSQSGRSLFTLEALPRDMVRVGRDRDGIKWAAVVEEIPGTDCAPESDLAKDYARRNGVPEDDIGLYGIWTDKDGRVVGGVPRGTPQEQGWLSPRTFVLIRFYNRIECVTLIARDNGSIDGALEIWRGRHGCRVQGEPACPVVEVPMMRTGINVAGHEFTTPMEPVFAYIPIINQMLTILSNATAINGIPRWVVELSDGSVLRGEDGEPVVLEQGDFVPGLDPAEALGVQGTLKQVLIDTESLLKELEILWARLDMVMPSEAATGDEGGSGPAWGKRLMIQQSQENLRQPIANHAAGVKLLLQMWHGWCRQLDMPIHFFAAAGHRSDKRNVTGLIEFDPKNLTDMISVTQSVDTPEEHTVLIQTGLELLQAGVITKRQFFDEYLRTPDAREAEIDMYVQMVLDQVMTGAAVPPGSVIQVISDGVRGQLQYILVQQSDNYSLAVAEGMAANAQMALQQQMQPPGEPQGGMEGGEANVAQAAGVSEPGINMSTSLEGQLGASAPGRGA